MVAPDSIIMTLPPLGVSILRYEGIKKALTESTLRIDG